MEKQLHEGHRARLRQSAKQDEELTSFSEFQVLEYFLSFIIPRKDTNPIAHALYRSVRQLVRCFSSYRRRIIFDKVHDSKRSLFYCGFFAYISKNSMFLFCISKVRIETFGRSKCFKTLLLRKKQ